MTITEIQRAIAGLSEQDYTSLSNWLREEDNERWDTQIAGDVSAGRLDKLMDEADEEYLVGKTKPL